jgi:hypothetical protein
VERTRALRGFLAEESDHYAEACVYARLIRRLFADVQAESHPGQ